MAFMKPIPLSKIPIHKHLFCYEIKYDGFRAALQWDTHHIKLLSKNHYDLSEKFPEIIRFCKEVEPIVQKYLPLTLDGELVILNHSGQANFSLIQTRGRTDDSETIQHYAKQRPASFLVFDMLTFKGKDLRPEQYGERKKILQQLFNEIDYPSLTKKRMQQVSMFNDPDELQKIVFEQQGEGIVAKKLNSPYQRGKSHTDWFKIKNWRTVYGFLTMFDPNNGYYDVQVYDGKTPINIGKCKHGLDAASAQTLKEFFTREGEERKDGCYHLPPAICVGIHTLDMPHGELREPSFAYIASNVDPEDCTIKKLHLDLAQLPPSIDYSNLEKVYWPEPFLLKSDLLIYLRRIMPYILPFLKDRLATLIRCPEGVHGDYFFQKSLPSYAPDFFKRVQMDGKTLIRIHTLETLIWFGNHGGIEYHIPFQRLEDQQPCEIVFDLDPPSIQYFDLAIKGALLIKKILDDLQLHAFIKTSGNTGLQIHIPIPPGSMSYTETGRFTEALATTIVQAEPTLFTIERMKKNRKKRLYIDYPQHGRNKTIIAPYSPRKTPQATVATPLFWEEVHEDLSPQQFTIQNVVKRVQTKGCPFDDYFRVQQGQNLHPLMELLR